MSDAYEEVAEADEQADELYLQRFLRPPLDPELCARCRERGLNARESCPTCGLPC
jgi:hypothetical protein